MNNDEDDSFSTPETKRIWYYKEITVIYLKGQIKTIYRPFDSILYDVCLASWLGTNSAREVKRKSALVGFLQNYLSPFPLKALLIPFSHFSFSFESLPEFILSWSYRLYPSHNFTQSYEYIPKNGALLSYPHLTRE